MHWRFIPNILGVLIFCFGLTMIFPMMVGIYYRDQSVLPIAESMAITISAGLILYLVFRKAKAEAIHQREGIPVEVVEVTATPMEARRTFTGSVRGVRSATVRARTGDEILVVGGHYDTVPGCPGANDNGTGVAATLEIARLLRDAAPARTVRLVAFVNEEPPPA